MACVPSEDSDQPGHLPSLIRLFTVRMKKALVLSYSLSPQRRLCSNRVDAQDDLSLGCAHSHFLGFVMRWLEIFNNHSRKHFGVRNPLYLKALLAYCHFSTEFKQDELGLTVAKVGFICCNDCLVGFLFYGSSTLLKSFRVQSVNLFTLFLGMLLKPLTSTKCPYLCPVTDNCPT